LIRIGAEVEAYCGEITDLDAFKDYLQQYSAAIRGTQKKEQIDTKNPDPVQPYQDFTETDFPYTDFQPQIIKDIPIKENDIDNHIISYQSKMNNIKLI
jgi:hypothetical protein